MRKLVFSIFLIFTLLLFGLSRIFGWITPVVILSPMIFLIVGIFFLWIADALFEFFRIAIKVLSVMVLLYLISRLIA